MAINPVFPFTEQPTKRGYVNNPRNVAIEDATLVHIPCGYWFKHPGGSTTIYNPPEPPTPPGAHRYFYSITESCYIIRFDPITGEIDFTYLVEGDTFAIGGYYVQGFGLNANGDFRIVSTALKFHSELSNPDSIPENFMVFDENFERTLLVEYDWTEGNLMLDAVAVSPYTYYLNNTDLFVIVYALGPAAGGKAVKIKTLNITTGAVIDKQTIAYDASRGEYRGSHHDGAGFIYMLFTKACLKYDIMLDTYTTIISITPPQYQYFSWLYLYEDRLLIHYVASYPNREFKVYDRDGSYINDLAESSEIDTFYRMMPEATKGVYRAKNNTFVWYDLANQEKLLTITLPITILTGLSFAFYDLVTSRIFIQIRFTDSSLSVPTIVSKMFCYDTNGVLLYTTPVLWPEQDYLVDWFAWTPTTDRTELRYITQLVSTPAIPFYIDNGMCIGPDGTSIVCAYILDREVSYYDIAYRGLWLVDGITKTPIISGYKPTSTVYMGLEDGSCATFGDYTVIIGWGDNADFIITVKNGVVTGDTSLYAYEDNDSVDINSINYTKLYYKEDESKLWLFIMSSSSTVWGAKVYESLDDGATWTQLEFWPVSFNFNHSPASYFFTVSNELYLCFDGYTTIYLYKYNETTHRFDSVRNKAGLTSVHSLFCNADGIYYSTNTGSSPYYRTFYKSVDFMQNWITLGSFQYPANYEQIDQPFTVSGQNIIAGIERPNSNYPEPYEFVIVSSDEGSTWVEINIKGVDYVGRIALVNSTVFLWGYLWYNRVAWDRGPVFKSSDYGTTWTECQEDFIGKIPFDRYELVLK